MAELVEKQIQSNILLKYNTNQLHMIEMHS